MTAARAVAVREERERASGRLRLRKGTVEERGGGGRMGEVLQGTLFTGASFAFREMGETEIVLVQPVCDCEAPKDKGEKMCFFVAGVSAPLTFISSSSYVTQKAHSTFS